MVVEAIEDDEDWPETPDVASGKSGPEASDAPESGEAGGNEGAGPIALSSKKPAASGKPRVALVRESANDADPEEKTGKS